MYILVGVSIFFSFSILTCLSNKSFLSPDQLKNVNAHPDPLVQLLDSKGQSVEHFAQENGIQAIRHVLNSSEDRNDVFAETFRIGNIDSRLNSSRFVELNEAENLGKNLSSVDLLIPVGSPKVKPDLTAFYTCKFLVHQRSLGSSDGDVLIPKQYGQTNIVSFKIQLSFPAHRSLWWFLLAAVLDIIFMLCLALSVLILTDCVSANFHVLIATRADRLKGRTAPSLPHLSQSQIFLILCSSRRLGHQQRMQRPAR